MYQYPGQGGQQPQPSQHRSGPPPAKKAKSGSGMVITKYAPPPGYQPPIRPPQPYSQPQAYGQPPAFTASGYGGYGQQPYTTFQAPIQQYGGYHPPTPSQTSISSPLPLQYGAQFPPTPTQSPAFQPPQQQYGAQYQQAYSQLPNMQNVPPPTPIAQQPTSDFNGFYSKFDPSSGGSISTTDPNSGIDLFDPPVPKEDLGEVLAQPNDLEHHYGELNHYWTHPNEILPELSLGTIGWYPPRPSKRPLPATFNEAELEALAPKVLKPEEETSVSEYCTQIKIHETLLSVRQTEYWSSVRHDTIYRELPGESRTGYVSRSELKQCWRNREDAGRAVKEEEEDQSSTPELSRGPTPALSAEPGDELNSHGIKIESSDDTPRAISKQREPDALDGIMEALSAQNQKSKHPTSSNNHSRSESISSQHSQSISRPKALHPVRDATQEDILAQLGVTGSPKTVYQTPGPAYASRPTSSQQDNSTWPTLPKVRGNPAAAGQQAPPQRRHDSGAIQVDQDNEATPRPNKYLRDVNRKRSYADASGGAVDERAGGDGDGERTPKARRTSYAGEGNR